MKRSQYLMAPVIALGLSTGCLGEDNKVKQKPDTLPTVAGVKQLAPGAECEHGGHLFTYTNKKTEKQCLPAPKTPPQTDGKPEVTPEVTPEVKPEAVQPGMDWRADLRVDGKDVNGGYATQVKTVEGNLHYDLDGVDTPHMPLLEEVGKDLIIGADQAEDGVEQPAAKNHMTHLKGLERLRKVGGTLHIRGNVKLTDLSGLANLESVGAIVIDRNAELKQFTLPPKLTAMKDMEVTHNAALTGIVGDNALTEFKGTLAIKNNPELTDLTGFAKVHKVKNLEVVGNGKLVSLQGLGALAHVESFKIINNAALTNVDGFKSLETVFELTLQDNASMGTQEDAAVGFPALKSVHSLEILGNKGMRKLGNFPAFAKAEQLVIQGNENLEAIDMPLLNGVQSVQIGPKKANKDNKTPNGNVEGKMTQKWVTHYEVIFTKGAK